MLKKKIHWAWKILGFAMFLTGGYGDITDKGTTLLTKYNEAKLKLGLNFNLAFYSQLGLDLSGKSTIFGITPDSDEMFQMYDIFFRNIFTCIQILEGESPFGIDVYNSLQIIKEKCRDMFISGEIIDDLKSALDELLNYDNTFEKYLQIELERGTSSEKAKLKAYDTTFNCIEKLLICYGEYFVTLEEILRGKENLFNDLVSKLVNSQESIERDVPTKYLLTAKQTFAYSALKQFNSATPEQLIESLKKRGEQTLKMEKIDSGVGHDTSCDSRTDLFPKEVIISLVKGVVEDKLLMDLSVGLRCIAVQPSEKLGVNESVTLFCCTKDVNENFLTRKKISSGVSVLYSCPVIPGFVSRVLAIVDLAVNTIFAPINEINLITSIGESEASTERHYNLSKLLLWNLVATDFDQASLPDAVYCETGKEILVFEEFRFEDSSQIERDIFVSFFTYNTSDRVENSLKLSKQSFIKKKTRHHDFYSIEEVIKYKESSRYKELENERGQLEEFSKQYDLYLKDKSDKDNNKTKRICEYLLDKFYKSPESLIQKSLTCNESIDPCNQLKCTTKDLFYEINELKNISEQTKRTKKGVLKEPTQASINEFKRAASIFLNSLKQNIGFAFINYFDGKINKDCFNYFYNIFLCLFESLQKTSQKFPEMEKAENEKIKEQQKKFKEQLIEKISEEIFKTIEGATGLSLLHSSAAAKGPGKEKYDDSEDAANQPFSFASPPRRDPDIEDIVNENIKIIKNYRPRIDENNYYKHAENYYNRLTEMTHEEKVENLYYYLKSELDDFIQKKVAAEKAEAASILTSMKLGGSKRTRRQRKKTCKKKTRKHKKIKHKKYTRPYKLKIGRKNTYKKYIKK